LDEHFSEKDEQQQIETALYWGRYAEILTYDPKSDMLHLHLPDHIHHPMEDEALH